MKTLTYWKKEPIRTYHSDSDKYIGNGEFIATLPTIMKSLEKNKVSGKPYREIVEYLQNRITEVGPSANKFLEMSFDAEAAPLPGYYSLDIYKGKRPSAMKLFEIFGSKPMLLFMAGDYFDFFKDLKWMVSYGAYVDFFCSEDRGVILAPMRYNEKDSSSIREFATAIQNKQFHIDPKLERANV